MGIFIFNHFKKMIFKPFPKLTVLSNGIKFKSFLRHRIKIDNAKLMQVGRTVYLRKNKKLITVNNVDEIYVRNGYLFFTAQGNCEILFPCSRVAKYFNINIKSGMFSITELKQKAIMSMLNNLFDLTKAKDLRKYLYVVKNTLKISITKQQVKVEQNQFKMPFALEYKANNTKKIVNINGFVSEK